MHGSVVGMGARHRSHSIVDHIESAGAVGTGRCNFSADQKFAIRWKAEESIVAMLFAGQRFGVDWHRRWQRLSIRFEKFFDQRAGHLS